ncbi:MAG: cytochrome-c peroxidase [Bacteroidales bacterium]
MRKIISILALTFISAVLFLHCSEKTEEAKDLTELQEKALAFTSPMPENAFKEGMIQSDEIIELGKMLFHEPRISKSGIISCNSCHSLTTFGVDQTPVSIGHGWQKGVRNAPTVLNAAFHKTQFWDGRAKDVEEQAGMPILELVEMGAREEHVLEVLASIPEYVERFDNVFHEQEKPLNYENVGIAIGAFERTLLTYSPFDDFLQGNANALSDEQKKGLEVFIETGCQTCHKGQVMGGEIFTFFQTPKEKETGELNMGRFDFTQRESDKHFFKVPSLLNVAMTYPYLHDGSVWSLNETVNIVAKEMLSRELTDEQNRLIVEFLKSLTGKISDHALELPVLPASTANTPKPIFDL